MKDMQRLAEALQAITGAVKLNYEIHGNTIPHLHVHLFPRYRGDPFEDGPIDPRMIQESPYNAGQFANFRHRYRGFVPPSQTFGTSTPHDPVARVGPWPT